MFCAVDEILACTKEGAGRVQSTRRRGIPPKRGDVIE